MLCKAEDRTCTDRNRHDHVYTCNTVGGLIVRLFVDSGKCASAHDQAIGWVSMTARDVDIVTQLSTVDYMPPFFTQSRRIQLSSIFCSCLCKPHQNFSLQAYRYHAIAVCIIKVGFFWADFFVCVWIYSLFCENNQGRSSGECTYRTSQSLANTFLVLTTVKGKLRYVISYTYMYKTRCLSQTEASFLSP